MAQRRARRFTAFTVALALVVAACSDDDDATTTTATPVPIGTTPVAPAADGAAPRMFGLTLSEGRAAALTPDTTPVVEGDQLPEGRLDEIVDRLPEWTNPADARDSFNWPIQSSPPPRSGAVIDESFPPAADAPVVTVPSVPLQVLRFQPEGDVALAPYVAITFDQPMVPVGTVGQVAAQDVPVTISPALDGAWQWIGTRTLRFDYSGGLIDRLPMATTYTVTVPAGTESATGNELTEEVSFAFATPPPTVQSFAPEGESLRLDQLFVASFDQRIDPAAALATISLKAGDDGVPLRLATAAEIEADDLARNTAQTAEESRWIAFRAVDPLPTDSAITVQIGPGTPSAEGPATSESGPSYRGRTYAPLKVLRVSCAFDDRCVPGSEIDVEFNNPLDPEKSDVSVVTVAPELAAVTAGLSYSSLVIRGATQARTEYTVTLPGSFTDVFGQTLGEATPVTVIIGEADDSIQGYEAITTLDPFAPTQQLSVLSTNHDSLRVRVFAADPSMLSAYLRYSWQRDNTEEQMPAWTVLSDATLTVDGEADTMIDTPIDLSGVLNGTPGHVIVLVEPIPALQPNDDDYYRNRPALTWVQSTQLGIDGFSDTTDATVWATDLRTGAPLADVAVTITGGASGTTDADGLAQLALPAPVGDSESFLVATRGGDSAVLPLQSFRQDQRDTLRWYVFDDRQVYRPGETVRVKGWLRRYTLSTDAELVAVDPDTTVQYVVNDGYGAELLRGEAPLGALGGFDLELALPETANVGQASISMTIEGEPGVDLQGPYHQFQIQEYRRPEFEVTTRAESAVPFVSTRTQTVAAAGAYFAGGPLAAAPVDWLVSTTPTTYAPPGWGEFTFGIWIPWWFSDGDEYRGDYSFDGGCCGPVDGTTNKEFHGVSDGAGTHYLQLQFDGDDGVLPDLPVAVTAEATITDVNRQAWSSRTDLLVHAADRYVGLRSSRAFVRQGDPLSIDAVVTGIDGDSVSGVAFEVVAGRVESTYANGEWVESVVDPQTCTVTSASDPVECEFETSVGGQYRVTAVVAGTDGGRNRTELTTWVSGAEAQPSRGVDQQTLTVVPDQVEYAPGDTAELLVQAPFASGEGLLTVSRNGVRDTIRFTIEAGSAIVQVPITEASVPQLSLNLEVVGSTVRTADDGTALPESPLRPAYAVGTMSLSVPPVSRTLTVAATPRDTELLPGGATTIDVSVTDAAGDAVQGSEFAVIVVDEAVLALSGYTLADPLSVFYAPGYDWLNAVYGRQQIRLLDPKRLAGDESGGAPTDDQAEGGSSATTAPSSEDAAADGGADYDPASPPSLAPGTVDPVDVRSDFDALALFEPSVVTDAAGTASIDVTLPDSLTRYRVMVVAVSDNDRFGSTESNITARLPLSVRPSTPRFANFGDSFELPVVVQNQTDAALDVDVVLQTSNLTITGADTGATGRRVTVPANDRIEVRFPVATDSAGTAGLRVTAVSGDLADSATTELPVYTPATAEAFATYGVIDSGAIEQPLLAPTDVVPDYGGLEVTTSSTSLQALTDALLYLADYDYDSSDSRASRIMAIAALADVLDAFAAEDLPSKADLDESVDTDVAGLVALQNDDGGFPYWKTYERSEPFNSIQATHALLLARDNGYAVPSIAIERALAFIADIESHIPNGYGPQERLSLSAYALWVRALAGQPDAAKAETLYERSGDDMTTDALAWVWGSVTDSGTRVDIERTLGNRAVETAGAANFVTQYDDSAYLIMQSDRRTDGIVLDALIANAPDSDLIPKVVTGLLANRVKGRWDNVQENSFILLALRSYFDEFEGQTPDFVAKVWLGDRFAGDHTFQGRETDRVNLAIPTSDLIAAGDTDLVVNKDGAGRLYYRIGLRYAPADLQLDALDRGFVVDRVYEAVDDPSDVTRDADGTWHVAAGARVRVTLTMVADSQRTHVALIDPLPAGLEALNPSLANTQTVPPPETDGGVVPAHSFDSWWWGTWYEHQQLRDDRVEAFTTLLPGGTYTYSYVARATTPGTFVVPPTRAEEMYAPETFGRTSTDRVIVEA